MTLYAYDDNSYTIKSDSYENFANGSWVLTENKENGLYELTYTEKQYINLETGTLINSARTVRTGIYNNSGFWYSSQNGISVLFLRE